MNQKYFSSAGEFPPGAAGDIFYQHAFVGKRRAQFVGALEIFRLAGGLALFYQRGQLCRQFVLSFGFKKVQRQHVFRGNSEGFTAWLFSIARNMANDHFRKSPTLVALETSNKLAAPGNVAEQVEQSGEFTCLVAAINRLPRRERDIITLKYGAELNNRQIARQLRLSESNIGTIVNRTLQKLRQEVEAHDER